MQDPGAGTNKVVVLIEPVEVLQGSKIRTAGLFRPPRRYAMLTRRNELGPSHCLVKDLEHTQAVGGFWLVVNEPRKCLDKTLVLARGEVVRASQLWIVAL
jgi:hypothetical protein